VESEERLETCTLKLCAVTWWLRELKHIRYEKLLLKDSGMPTAIMCLFHLHNICLALSAEFSRIYVSFHYAC